MSFDPEEADRMGKFVLDMFERGMRVADDGVWVERRGFIEEKGFTIIVALGDGSDRLRKFMEYYAILDPRSTIDEKPT